MDMATGWADESLYFYQKRLKFTFDDAARQWTERVDRATSRPAA
jgi:hypothetical protein